MPRIVIFGNSSSGKSTLASALAKTERLAHLDLGTMAWEKLDPVRRRPLAESQRDMDRFMEAHSEWVRIWS